MDHIEPYDENVDFLSPGAVVYSILFFLYFLSVLFGSKSVYFIFILIYAWHG